MPNCSEERGSLDIYQELNVDMMLKIIDDMNKIHNLFL